jgi:hypothetical protein
MESMFFPRTASGYEHDIQFDEGNEHVSPKCREDNGVHVPEDDDIECWKCKMVYRRSISWISSLPLLSSSMMTAKITPAAEALPIESQIPENVSSSKTKRKKSHDEDNEMALFRRVRIKTLIGPPAPVSRPGYPEKEEIYENSEPPLDEVVPNLGYLDQLASFHRENGSSFYKVPIVDKRPLDLYKLKRAVEARGGFESVCTMKKWAEICRDLGYRGRTIESLYTSLRNTYQRWLVPYEEYLETNGEDVSQQTEKKWEYGGPLTPSPASSPDREELGALTTFINGHHKPVRKHNNMAHKRGLPYVVPRMYSIDGP